MLGCMEFSVSIVSANDSPLIETTLWVFIVGNERNNV